MNRFMFHDIWQTPQETIVSTHLVKVILKSKIDRKINVTGRLLTPSDSTERLKHCG